MTFDPWLRNC